MILTSFALKHHIGLFFPLSNQVLDVALEFNVVALADQINSQP